MKRRLYTRFIGIIVAQETYEQMKAITDRREISTTQFIRELIQREIESIERKEKGK